MADQMDIIVQFVDEATQSIKSIKNEMAELSDSVETTNQRTTNFTDTLKNGLVALGTGALLNAVKNVTFEVINQAAAFEQSQVAFATMLGSAEAGTAYLQDLADFAATTPFTLPGVENSARLLLAMGIEAENTIPTLKALGDVSAGLSVPIEQVALAYGQVRAANQLMGSELRQFIQAGVPLLSELAEMFGVNEAEIKKMVEQGKVGFSDVEEAFKRMTSEGGQFENLMQKQSTTWNGMVSNLKDSVTILMREVGGPLLEALKPALESIVRLMTGLIDELRAKGFNQFFEDHKTIIITLAGVIGGVLVGAVIGLGVALWGLLAPVLGIGLALGVLGGLAAFFIKNIVEGWPTVVAVFDEVKEVISGVIGYFSQLLEDGDYLNDNLQYFPQFFQDAMLGLHDIIESVSGWFAAMKDSILAKIAEIRDGAVALWQGFIDGVIAVWNGLVTAATTIWSAVVAVFTFWVSFITGLVLLAFEAMGIDLVAVFTAIKDGIVATWNALSEWFAGALEFFSQLWQETWQGISDFASMIWDGIVGFVTSNVDHVTTKVQEGVNTASSAWQTVWTAVSSFTKGIWEGIKAIFTDAMALLTAVFTPWVDTLKSLWISMWDSVTSAATTAWETAKSIVKSAINWIIERVNDMIDAINAVAAKGAGVLGVDAPRIDTIPLLADGGNVISAGRAIVGEAGPEMVDLPHGARVTPLNGDGAGGGMTIIVNINNPMVLNEDDIVERLGDPLIEVLKKHTAIV